MKKLKNLSQALLLASIVASPSLLNSCGSGSGSGSKADPIPPAPVVKTVPKVVAPKPISTVKKAVVKKNPTVNISSGSASGVSHYRGSASSPYVALTFDDGPHPVHTPKLLNTLRSHNVKATFYVTGQNASRYPALIRRIVNEGHEIGNHTYTHPNLTKLSNAEVRRELDRSTAAIVSAAGVKPRTFRPPYGALTTAQRSWINSSYGYPIVFWTVDPKDWKDRNASLVSSRTVAGAKNGAILLLHDIHATSVAAVPQTINSILSKGYKFVTISQLLSKK